MLCVIGPLQAPPTELHHTYPPTQGLPDLNLGPGSSYSTSSGRVVDEFVIGAEAIRWLTTPLVPQHHYVRQPSLSHRYRHLSNYDLTPGFVVANNPA